MLIMADMAQMHLHLDWRVIARRRQERVVVALADPILLVLVVAAAAALVARMVLVKMVGRNLAIPADAAAAQRMAAARVLPMLLMLAAMVVQLLILHLVVLVALQVVPAGPDRMVQVVVAAERMHLVVTAAQVSTGRVPLDPLLAPVVVAAVLVEILSRAARLGFTAAAAALVDIAGASVATEPTV